MKIRLVLPIINEIPNRNKFKSIDSFNIKKRLNILNYAMKWKNQGIDLIVTSNNFFALKSTSQFNYIKQKIDNFRIKKSFVIGMDLLYAKNTFGGINASVFYFEKHIKYKITKQIWEVWNNKKECCVVDNFTKQNRVINIQGKSFTLLSCGDILKKVHKIKGLPNTDVYLDLAHLNFSNYLINQKDHCSWIQQWKGEEKTILLTQQISKKNLQNKNYYDTNTKRYKLIYPKKIWEHQKVNYFNSSFKQVASNPSYILVDIEIL